MRKFVLSAVACLVFPSVVAACPPQLQFFAYRAPVIERQIIRQRVEYAAPVVRERIVQKQRAPRFFVPRANFRSVERIRSNY